MASRVPGSAGRQGGIIKLHSVHRVVEGGRLDSLAKALRYFLDCQQLAQKFDKLARGVQLLNALSQALIDAFQDLKDAIDAANAGKVDESAVLDAIADVKSHVEGTNA